MKKRIAKRRGEKCLALLKKHDSKGVQELVDKHKKGYEKHPVEKGEFDVWEREQVWPEL